MQRRVQLQGPRKGASTNQGGSIPWVEISKYLTRGVRIRHDNMVKNHWNGSLSSCYFNRTLSTRFVRRQKVMLPLEDMMALLQASL